VITPVECPFCEIIKHEDPDAREIYRDEYVIAFFPTEPATLGHTLLVPRRHIEDIWSLDESTAAKLAVTAVRLATAVRSALNPQGLNIIQSNGDAASQSVPHVHVHIVPRWTNDAIGRIWPPETNYTEEQKDDAWERLKAASRRLVAK
jgi:histidine triad (HIT) family protein